MLFRVLVGVLLFCSLSPSANAEELFVRLGPARPQR